MADLTEAIAAAAAAGTLIDNIDVDPDSIVVENGISISYDLQLFTKSHIIVNDREMWSRGFHWKAYFFFLFQKTTIAMPRLVNSSYGTLVFTILDINNTAKA